ncbi:OLC1v1007754C1 [Oldenlandia corymbosa var. corymbosa]|uniref:OLC1v1007754C1 n=1 Tax=Oldenlandia corymbosa var. corymbosa TaxID=529605 RepID=A0AAV1DKE1_OLDCO|nr:OLC1v1007754C1 [Oldenlandia corymbosa var. corymbosa]
MLSCCCSCSNLRTQIETWLRDYDRIQSSAVVLIYIQIGCALIGSLGALYSGVLLIDLAIGLFALVAIESSSQSLGRTYAVLLFCSILLDICWFILFAHDIWTISQDTYGTFVVFSVKLTLCMQIVGFSVRLFSSLLWIQMYRLGVSYLETSVSVPHEADAVVDLRSSFLNPATPSSIVRQPSVSNDVLGGSIYDPAYYSSLFEEGKDDASLYMVGQNHDIVIEPTATAEASEEKLFLSRSLLRKDVSCK